MKHVNNSKPSGQFFSYYFIVVWIIHCKDRPDKTQGKNAEVTKRTEKSDEQNQQKINTKSLLAVGWTKRLYCCCYLCFMQRSAKLIFGLKDVYVSAKANGFIQFNFLAE